MANNERPHFIIDPLEDNVGPYKYASHKGNHRMLGFAIHEEKEAQEKAKKLQEAFKDEDYRDGYTAIILGFGLGENPSHQTILGFAQASEDFDLERDKIPTHPGGILQHWVEKSQESQPK